MSKKTPQLSVDPETLAERILEGIADAGFGEFDGIIPATAADGLEAEYSLAAPLMRRAMVRDTLAGGKSKQYRYAARHLAECQSCDLIIDDYGDFPAHAEFVKSLKQKPGRKYGFWKLVEG